MHVIKAGNLKNANNAIASINGSRYKTRSLIDHVQSLAHKSPHSRVQIN